QDRVADGQAGHARCAEPEALDPPGERRQEHERLHARLGEQAVAYPHGLEELGPIGDLGHLDELLRGRGPEIDAAVRQGEPELHSPWTPCLCSPSAGVARIARSSERACSTSRGSANRFSATPASRRAATISARSACGPTACWLNSRVCSAT